MRFLTEENKRLVIMEENDNPISAKAWFIRNTTCKYQDFDEKLWTVTPEPGDVFVLPKQVITDPEVQLWPYPLKGEEKEDETPETKFQQLHELLVNEFGEEGAKHVIARLAYEASKQQHEMYQQFYEQNVDKVETQRVPTVSATWEYQKDETSKE